MVVGDGINEGVGRFIYVDLFTCFDGDSDGIMFRLDKLIYLSFQIDILRYLSISSLRFL